MILAEREQMYLWRRRHGLSQAQVAKRLRIHPDTLGERERGQAGPLGGLPGGVSQLKATSVEELVVLRRRARLSQKEVARRIGVSRHSVMAWERGEWDWDRLAEYWAISSRGG